MQISDVPAGVGQCCQGVGCGKEFIVGHAMSYTESIGPLCLTCLAREVDRVGEVRLSALEDRITTLEEKSE